MMSTPLGILFHRAFQSGKTCFNENGVQIAITPMSGETVLVFRMDDASVAAALGIGSNEPRADAMLLYVLELKDQKPLFRLVLLELKKGSDHERAIDQLDRTLAAVKQRLSPLLGNSFFTASTLRALIVSKSGPPRDLKKKQLHFHNKWKFTPEVCRPHENDLRKQLR